MPSIALLVVALIVPQSGNLPGLTPVEEDVARLVRAAETSTGTWPAQAPPPIPEVAVVARHGKRATPLSRIRYDCRNTR